MYSVGSKLNNWQEQRMSFYFQLKSALKFHIPSEEQQLFSDIETQTIEWVYAPCWPK